MSKRVLIFEPDKANQDLLTLQINGQFEISYANSIDEMEEIYADDHEKEIFAIAITTTNPHLLRKTKRFVIEKRRSFEGSIIIVSESENIKETFFDAECDYGCQNKDLADVLKKIFILQCA